MELFKEEIKPFVEDSDPYKEKRYIGPTRYSNPRAYLIKIVPLYEGDPRKMLLGSIGVEINSFIDIRRLFYANGEWTSLPFVHYGLKDALTGRDIPYYSSSTYDADPIHLYRESKILELLPYLNKNSHQAIYSAGAATSRVFYSWTLSDPEERAHYINARRTIRSLIGASNFRNILNSLPPRLEEMINAMRKHEVPVITDNLEREQKTKRLILSEFFIDRINEDHQRAEDFAQGLEDIGWL